MPYVLIDQPRVLEHEVPMQVRLKLHEDLIERDQRLLARHKDLSCALTAVHDDYCRQIVALVGEDARRANLERREDLRRQFAALSERYARTPDGERARHEEHRRLLSAKHQFYHHDLGIDVERALAIRRETMARVRALTHQHIGREIEAPPEAAVQPPTYTANPWTWYTPAFAYQWTWMAPPDGTSGNVWKGASAWAPSGEVNLMSWIQLFGAGDKDWQKTDGMAEVGVWFLMPAAGMLEAWAWFQDINTDYSGFLQDAAGCSDAYVHQLSRVYLWTLGSTERYATVMDYERGELEGTWDYPGTSTGSVNAWHFLSQKAYAAGEWVYASFGVRDYNMFDVNDESCRSRMYSQYFVKQLALRATGAA